MQWRYNRKLIGRARDMRRDKMTPAEKRLWTRYLEGHTPRWRNQRPIGPYIADFYCASAKLVVELDGDAHFTLEGRAYDAERTAYLEGLGLHILRFTNLEVYESLEGVCRAIEQTVRERIELIENQDTNEG